MPEPPQVNHGKLPSYGMAYLALLIGEFNSIKDICKNEEAKELGQRLVDKAEKLAREANTTKAERLADAWYSIALRFVAQKPNTPKAERLSRDHNKPEDVMTWGDAYMLDTAIAQMMPTEYLHQRAWCLEVKYKDAVGNADAYDMFMKIESPHLCDETDLHLRARTHNMIRELYRLYAVIQCRADMRDELSKSALWTLVFVFVVMALVVGMDYRFGSLHYVDVWCMVFTAGAAGGLLSLQRRLQSLPGYGESLSDLVELSGRMTVRFTPIIGGVFAIVLFLIFSSGLATGPLFPTLPIQLKVSDFKSLIEHLQPETTLDWGKLLVWSFIAGFAERFVPDTLDRLIARSEQSKNKVK